ncbi:REP-associated tyrosine transposase [Thiococcus pfennigii]|jgi:putative transposase|uniref:REP-associated tyrosine transposase n=1 Tax=Thiococcus pfennigii TaxID=1057 RepID=UPI0019031740|nr:transposase [Thiococcus pfennigii]MBK1700402.1 transposase [Thiococcus pfennigii]MBK1731619.1 transposase [Thiococcus pfennigii]
MTDYRRLRIPGATWFFTVNLARRHDQRLLVEQIAVLGEVFRAVKAAHPFRIEAICVLPDHLHCIWTLPAGDSAYATRWALIKAGFSRALPAGEPRSQSRAKRGERGIWQRRFWEHAIRDERDLARHIDYIHWNPVKHGWVPRVGDWPHSSFHAYVRRGRYPADWADPPGQIDAGE